MIPLLRLLRAVSVLLAVMPGLALRVASAEFNGAAVANLKPALPIIPERTFKLSDFGAVGNGRALNTAVFKKAIAAVEKAGGGKLVVPKGIFLTGPLTLCSSLELHLEAGAVIQAPNTFEAVGLPNPASLKTQATADASFKIRVALVTGQNLHDVAITGPGIIDGSGAQWWAWSERAARNDLAAGKPPRWMIPRPHLLAFNGIQRLRIADITLTNAPMSHVAPYQVTDLTIERVKIRAPLDDSAPDTAGVDCGSVTRAWIHHSEIETGGDNIMIRAGGSEILIEDCFIKHGRGITIASETIAGVRDMLVRRCTFDGTENGIRIASAPGLGGVVENVRYTELTMKSVLNPIVLQLGDLDRGRSGQRADAAGASAIRNILIDHVNIQGAQNAGTIHGLPESRISGVTLRDMTVSAENDFEVRDAEDPNFERVHTTISPGVFRAQSGIAD